MSKLKYDNLKNGLLKAQPMQIISITNNFLDNLPADVYLFSKICSKLSQLIRKLNLTIQLNTYNYSRLIPTNISMTPFNIIASLTNLRALVQNQTDTYLVLKCIDSISNEVNRFEQIKAEISQLRSQAKKMKNKTKMLQKKMCQCSKQRDNLAEQLEKAKHIHNSKLQQITQLISYSNQTEQPSRKPQKSKKTSRACFGVQCQIITQSQVIELTENQKKLLIKLQILSQKYDDLQQQNKTKDIYISEILLALQCSSITDLQNDDEKSNDDSTLDDNSEKAQEIQVDQYLHQQSQREDDESWFQGLFEKSLKLYSFIFN